MSWERTVLYIATILMPLWLWLLVSLGVTLVVPLWSGSIDQCELTIDGIETYTFTREQWEPGDRFELDPYLPPDWTCLEARCMNPHGIWSVPWRTHRCH